MLQSEAPRARDELAGSRSEPGNIDNGGLSVVIPAYNEELGVGATIERLLAVLEQLERLAGFEIIVVNDGSEDGTGRAVEPYVSETVRLINHKRNRGYGAALKTGFQQARYEWVMIFDADGTYDEEAIENLLDLRPGNEMVVGARTGKDAAIPLIRRPAKWFLRKFASYLARHHIPDLNSGQRLIKKQAVERYARILPDGFSFTTTITLAMLCANRDVEYVAINYHHRKGRSKIRPIHDTLDFFLLVLRTTMFFEPLRVFLPVSMVFLLSSVAVGLVSTFVFGRLMDVTTVVLFVTGLLLLALGLLADLINRRLP